jgi:hypothetical protein
MGDDHDDEAEELDPLGHPKQAWCVQLAERGDDGEWRVVGEPLPDAQFDGMGLAHTWAENRNRRDFGKRFDWANEPDRGWIAVRIGTVGDGARNR